jgi:hypothetical protein
MHKKTTTKNDIAEWWSGINEFKKDYQAGTKFLKVKTVNLLARSHGISK